MRGGHKYLSCSIQSLFCHPIGIRIFLKDTPNIYINFLPEDVNSVFIATGLTNNVIDVPVCHATSILRFEKIIESDNHIGFRIKQLTLNSQSNPLKTIFIPVSEHVRFQTILTIADDTIQLQHEILSQQYATFEIVARKFRHLSTYSREVYYWEIMSTFFGLEVKGANRLPAYFVLRDFIESYLCDSYALYYNHKCECPNCISVIR